MTTTTLRQRHWDGCYNIRELGGLPTQDGGQASIGALIRVDIPSRLTAYVVSIITLCTLA